MHLTIRPETPADYPVVFHLHWCVFEGDPAGQVFFCASGCGGQFVLVLRYFIGCAFPVTSVVGTASKTQSS